MPHLTIEYSGNLETRVDLQALVQQLHDAALATGIFPEKGLRTRAAPRDVYRIADGHPDNAFIHVLVRIGSGRDLETRRRAGAAIFAALVEATRTDQDHRPLALSLEIQEIHPDLTWKHNNLEEWMAARSEESR